MAIEFVDTHCHIQSAGDGPGSSTGERITREKWAKSGHSAEEIISHAHEAGVSRMICVGCDLNDSRLAVNFVQDKPNTWASIGIHPHEAQHYVDDVAALADFATLATEDKVVAVGECGLDYYYGHSPQADQAKILRFQIELALKHNLPMIFHVRDALDDFWPIFDSYTGIRGVLHSFTDTSKNLDKAIERGLYIGVNGIATFTKDNSQLEMYKNIPLSRLLLETDAPFLTPSPYRGSICEPYHTSVVAEFTAKLREIGLEQLADATTSNAKELFQLN
jgi:TatD DNase family protein